MDHQSYCAKIETHFQKSEYISIAHHSFKMLTAPKSHLPKDLRVFCFIVHDREAEAELCQKLAKYAMSVAFYDDSAKKGKLSVIPLFISEKLSDKTLKLIKGRALKTEGALIVPAAFDLSQHKLFCCESFPIIGASSFKETAAFAKKVLHP